MRTRNLSATDFESVVWEGEFLADTPEDDDFRENQLVAAPCIEREDTRQAARLREVFAAVNAEVEF